MLNVQYKLMYFVILKIEITFGTKSFGKFKIFQIVLDIHLGLGLVRIILIIRNSTIKQNSFRIYVGFESVQIYFFRLGSVQVFRFDLFVQS